PPAAASPPAHPGAAAAARGGLYPRGAATITSSIVGPTLSNAVHPRLRVYHGDQIALGPGKVALLQAIDEAGTLAEAARRLGMSYMRAWKLLQTMNACFKEPLVDRSRSGSAPGDATLTPTGRAVLTLYRRMERETAQAIEDAWKELQELLADAPGSS